MAGWVAEAGVLVGILAFLLAVLTFAVFSLMFVTRDIVQGFSGLRLQKAPQGVFLNNADFLDPCPEILIQ